MISVSFVFALLASSVASARPMSNRRELTAELVHQFPDGTWIENMAIRNNGQILATNLGRPEVFLVDPKTPSHTPAIAIFANGTGNSGIVEVEQDVFYVINTRIDTSSFTVTPNSTVIYELDMRAYNASIPGDKAKMRIAARVPDAMLLNGLALLNRQHRTILASDSTAGVVYHIDTCTGESHVVIDDLLFKITPVIPNSFQTGVNGLRVVGSTLYFSSTTQGVIGTVPIDQQGRATGAARVLGHHTSNADDFDIDASGYLWVAQNNNNTVSRVSPSGQSVVVAGMQNSSQINGPTAAKFGRTDADKHILYVSTDGFFGDESVDQGRLLQIKTRQ